MSEDREDDYNHLELRLLFKDVFQAEIKPPDWIIKDLLPVGLTFLAGPPKSQKSTLTAAIGALVGELECKALPPYLSKTQKTGKVLWFSYEATGGELRYMLETGLGVKPGDSEVLMVVDEPWEFRLDDPGAVRLMMECLDYFKPRLVICDPLAEMHELEEKDAVSMIRILRPLRRWAVENEASVLVVHHTRKAGAEHTGQYEAADMRGSGAIFGKADGILILSPNKKEDAPIRIKAIFKRGEGWEQEIIFGAYGKQAVEPLQDDDKGVIMALAAGCDTAENISAMLSQSRSNVMESLKRLERAGLARNLNKKWIKV